MYNPNRGEFKWTKTLALTDGAVQDESDYLNITKDTVVLNVNVEDVEGIEDDRLSIANLNEDETAYIANAMVILGTGDKKDDAVLVVIAQMIHLGPM